MAFRGVDLQKFSPFQEAVLYAYYARERRIELQKTVALISAIINPQKAQETVKDLIEELFPESETQKTDDVKRMVAAAKQFEKESLSVEVTPEGTLRMK